MNHGLRERRPRYPRVKGRGVCERGSRCPPARVAVFTSERSRSPRAGSQCLQAGVEGIAVSAARVDLFTGEGSRSLRAKASFPRARVVVSVSPRGSRSSRANGHCIPQSCTHSALYGKGRIGSQPSSIFNGTVTRSTTSRVRLACSTCRLCSMVGRGNDVRSSFEIFNGTATRSTTSRVR